MVNVMFWQQFWGQFFWEDVREFFEEWLDTRVLGVTHNFLFWGDDTEKDFSFFSNSLINFYAGDQSDWRFVGRSKPSCLMGLLKVRDFLYWGCDNLVQDNLGYG